MASPNLKESKVKVAVVGFGHLGKWHVEKANCLERAELVAVVESDPQVRERVKELHPQCPVFSDISQVVDDIDAAIIATPTSTHFELVKFCIDNSKHIFCEKPLASSLDEANEIAKSAKNKSLVIQVGHSERFHQAWSERERFPEFFKSTGTIRISRIAPFKGRAVDVDVVRDLMIHDLDLLCYLLEDVPTKVHSIGYKIRTDKWDYVTSKFSFNSGQDAFLTVARNHVKEVRDFEITNENGCLYVDLLNSEFHVARANATEEHGFVETDKYNSRDHLLDEQRHFYNSILDGSPVIVGLDDGVLAVKLVDRVLHGLEHDCEVVV